MVIIKRFMLTLSFAFSLSLGLSNPASAAVEVNISVDKNPVSQGASFVLTVIADDHLSRTAWQPEQQLDQFRVLSTSVSSNTQIINGETSRSTEFRTVLQAPNEPGRYQIGPLQVAGVLSNTIELEVVPLSAEQQAQQLPAAFIEVTVDRDQLYVQQQLQLTAQLYLGANLLSGNILPPQLEHAEISQLGKDQESYEMRNGKRYQVFQRTYLITPQRSGELTITAPVFTGQINAGRSLSPFSTMNSAEAVTTSTAPLPITVLPVPPEWPTDSSWLPAELATISVDRVNQNTTAKVGEPLLLEYRITAIGVQSDLLPQFRIAAIAGVDSYPEPSQRQTSERNGKLVAQQVTQVAIIPRQSGWLEIPPQTLVWFNTVTGEVERSQTQPLRIEVAAASGLQPQAPQRVVTEPQAPLSTSTDVDQPVAVQTSAGLWPYALMLVIAAWATTTVLLLWRIQQLRQPRRDHSSTVTTAPADALTALRKACTANDAEQAELALKQWAQQLQLDPPYLVHLANHFQHAPFKSQLAHLSQCRYAAASPSWQEGKALWRAVQAVKRSNQQQLENRSLLPKLYPGES